MPKFIGNILRFRDPAGVLPYWEFPQTLNRELGAQRVEFIGHEVFPDNDPQGEGWVDEGKLRDKLEGFRQPSIVMLNMEGANWVVAIPEGEDSYQFIPERQDKLLRIMEFCRRHSHPQTTFGFFNQPPQGQIGSVLGHNGSGPPNYTEPIWRLNWHRRNLLMRPLGECQDFLMPHAYDYQWRTLESHLFYLEELIDEARMYGRPVYPVVWHHWKTEDGWMPCPVKRYQMTLELCLRRADGVVLWSENKNDNWDPHAHWWLACREVIREFQFS